MWWQNLLWGFWNGLTAWIVLIVHVFGGWGDRPFHNLSRSGNWYDFGFLVGAGSPPFLGAATLAGERQDRRYLTSRQLNRQAARGTRGLHVGHSP
jgi:hypothetical protein